MTRDDQFHTINDILITQTLNFQSMLTFFRYCIFSGAGVES